MILRLTAAAKRFAGPDGGVWALDGVDLDLHAGESLAVVGPSGSGKSTLLALAGGLERPDRGTVAITGVETGPLSDAALDRLRAAQVGFVFQSFRLIGALSALENVRLPLELAGRRDADSCARTWLDRVGLAARAGHRPAQLSGGEQQRVAIARALAPGPALVLADEPTGNLDGRNGEAMGGLLLGLVREHNAALLLATHDAGLAARASRILRLRDGRIDG